MRKIPVITEILKIPANWKEIPFFINYKTFLGQLYSTVDLFGFKGEIMLQIYSIVSRETKTVSEYFIFKTSGEFFLENLIFDLVFGAMILKNLMKIFAIFIWLFNN